MILRITMILSVVFYEKNIISYEISLNLRRIIIILFIIIIIPNYYKLKNIKYILCKQNSNLNGPDRRANLQ